MFSGVGSVFVPDYSNRLIILNFRRTITVNDFIDELTKLNDSTKTIFNSNQ